MSSNIGNVFLLVLASVPAALAYVIVLRGCPLDASNAPGMPTWFLPTNKNEACAWCHSHPFGLANIIFLVCVSFLFWIISLAQKSTWLIDPYWTIIPPLLGLFYRYHPGATERNGARALASLLLVFVWSLRLSHSYFRREGWICGKREDWRYADLRKKYPKHWWWMSFFAVYLSQQVMLIGICMPLYAVNFDSRKPWNLLDTLSVFLCLVGIVIAYFSDTQLHEFVTYNERQSSNRKKVPILKTGLWKYSRHPNYFGEQLFWWGMSLFAVNVGWVYAIWGTVLNSVVLATVTVMVEKRMVERKHRARAFIDYKQKTSVWIPWFPSPDSTRTSKQF